MAESAQHSGYLNCRDDFVRWVVEWINNVKGEHDWEARLSSLHEHVRMATKRLSDGDMRRSKLPTPQDISCDASRCSAEYSQVVSLALRVRICGARGRSVAAECMTMEARRVTQYLRRRRDAAGKRWLESGVALRAIGIERCSLWVHYVSQHYEVERQRAKRQARHDHWICVAAKPLPI